MIATISAVEAKQIALQWKAGGYDVMQIISFTELPHAYSAYPQGMALKAAPVAYVLYRE